MVFLALMGTIISFQENVKQLVQNVQKCSQKLFEWDGQLVLESAFEEREVFFMSVLLSEEDTGVGFGWRWSMTRAVGTCLYDMHYAVFAWIAANIERVCSHQNAAHRFYTRVKFYACHVVGRWSLVVSL